MPVKTMNPTLGDVLKREYSREVCREQVTQHAGSLRVGAVLGRIAVNTAAVTVAATAGNTGNGTLTPNASPVRAGARPGVYAVRFTAATTFNVVDPQGDVIGTGQVGTAFANEIAFNTAAGGTAFVAGDSFTVTVAQGSGRVVALADATAADGSHIVAGVLLADTDASAAPQATVMLARGPAVVSQDALIWPAAFNTAALRAPGLAALAALGIVARTTD